MLDNKYTTLDNHVMSSARFSVPDSIAMANMHLQAHIEEFAAAFLKHTELSPDKVVMKVMQSYDNGNITLNIWFEKRKGE